MPTLNLQPNPGEDTFLHNVLTNNNYGTTTFLDVGRGPTYIARGLIRFDLSSVPAGVSIVSATLRLRCIFVESSSAHGIGAYRSLVQWYAGGVSNTTPPPGQDASTWAHRNANGSVAWPGGMAGGATWASLPTDSVNVTVSGANYDWDVTADVQAFYSGAATNSGWWMRTAEAFTNELKSFASSNNSNNQPLLIIEYESLDPIDVTPVPATAAGSTALGAAIEMTTVAPGPASAVGTVAVGTVRNTILVEPPPAGAGGDTAGPDVVYGSIVLAGTPAEGTGRTLLGGLATSPAPADAAGELAGPVVAIDTPVTPPPAGAIGDTAPPTLFFSSHAATPQPTAARGETFLGGFARRPNAAEAVGVTFLGGLMHKPRPATAVGSTVQTTFVVVRKERVNRRPAPLLYLTDGVARFDLLDARGGFQLCHWRPAVAQYKGGGQWSDSNLANGRRLVLRRFANPIEVMEFEARGQTQDELLGYAGELLRWLERAADYGASRHASQPIYLVARSAYEQNERYALVHAGSVPEMEDLYDQPFFTARGKPVFRGMTLRLERGQWTDQPPGLGAGVALSSIRSWTVSGWQSSEEESGDPPPDPPPSSGPPPVGPPAAVTGDVLALVQAANGDALAGTSDGAALYRSTNNGQSWTLITRLGSGADRVNELTRDNSGNLYAAVSGGAAARGIWKSVNNGANWSKVLNHPGAGFTGVAWVRYNSTLVAVGFGVSSGSNVWVSADGGGFWFNPGTNHNAFDIKAVAAPDAPGLPTQYPWAGGPAFAPLTPPQRYNAHLATDSFYTVPYGAGRGHLGGASAERIPSGEMGNGGLDMVGYAVRLNISQFSVRFLWAVRSHLNTNNTELWQWPDPSQSTMPGMDRYARIATVAGETFNALYVDTAPDATSTQRTIWAGASGKIFVSYNSGYTWALASDVPANPVKSFVRLANGVLLAGCDNGEIVVYSGDSGSSGGGSEPVDPPPAGGGSGSGGGGGGPAVGGPVVNTQPLGRSATTREEVYVANKTSFSNLTHVLFYDGADFTNLQYGTEPPYSLLGDAPAGGNMCYFGSRTSDTTIAAGPFSSLVFELTQSAQNLTVVWEYWDGTVWETLSVQDGTSGFRVLGVRSVHWQIPADWATTDVAGVTGYWVRARVSAATAPAQGPIHWPLTAGGVTRADRYIYTVNLPFVNVGADVVGGEMPALAEIRWRNRADNPAGAPALKTHRLLVGLRSHARGPAFDAYINLSDRQVPFGVTLESLDADGGFEDALRAPTGRRYSVSYSSGNLNQWRSLVRVSLSTTIAQDYYGDFRVFLRGLVTPGDEDDWQFRLALGFGSGGITSFSREQFGRPAQVDFRLFDLGAIQIPNTALGARDLGDRLTLTVQGRATTNNIAAKLYDLILIPTDEWAGDFLHANFADAGDAAALGGGDYLDIDSIRNPKKELSAFNRLDNGLIKSIYQSITNGPAILQAKTRQRLWFLAAQFDSNTGSYGADPAICGTVQVLKQQQYLGARGAE